MSEVRKQLDALAIDIIYMVDVSLKHAVILAIKRYERAIYSQSADTIATLQERNAELEVELTTIANMAHHGGLINKGSRDIRMALLPYWDKEACAKLQAEPEGSE
jgi:hypothetical protein